MENRLFSLIGGVMVALILVLFWSQLNSLLDRGASVVWGLSVVVFLFYFALEIIFSPAIHSSVTDRSPSVYAKLFILFFFFLGLISIFDANPMDIPSGRDFATALHVLALWGGAMIVSDVVKVFWQKWFK